MQSHLKDAVTLGPAESYGDTIHQASHVADAPVPIPELIDIVGSWQHQVAGVSANVGVPVEHRAAEHDKLWVTDANEVHIFAERLAASRWVDAAMVSGTGKCMDFYHLGSALQIQH